MSFTHVRFPLVVSIVVFLLVGAGPALAVDKRTFRCQVAFLKATDIYGRAHATCLVDCERERLAGDSNRVCVDDQNSFTPPVLDATTLACIAKAQARYFAKGRRPCRAEVYPACSSWGSDIVSHTQGDINFIAPLLDSTMVPFFLCDAANFECGAGAIAALGKYSRGLTTCFRQCAKALRLRGDSSRQCIPFDHDIEAVDFETRHCIVKARARAEDEVAKACPLFPAEPNCGLLPFVSVMFDFATTNFAEGYDNNDEGPYCEP